MKVSQLVTMLSNLDQEKEINFTFQVELGRSFMFGSSGDLYPEFDEVNGQVVFGLIFDEDNCDEE